MQFPLIHTGRISFGSAAANGVVVETRQGCFGRRIVSRCERGRQEQAQRCTGMLGAQLHVSRKNLVQHVAMHVGQSHVAAAVSERETFVIDA